MNDQDLTPEEQRALDDLLDGEFDFYGLISARKNLLGPVIRWKYERTAGRAQRTIECRSREGVPHGDDVAVYWTLLQLYARQPGAPAQDLLEVTVDTFREQFAALFPEITLTTESLYWALHRLSDTTCIVTHVSQAGDIQTTRRWVFAFLTVLILFPAQDEVPDRLEAFVFGVAGAALSLHRTGQLGEIQKRQA